MVIPFRFAAQRGRNLPGDCDLCHGWQGIFAASSSRRERSDSRVRVNAGLVANELTPIEMLPFFRKQVLKPLP
jgi:hypothetical protein